MLTTVSASVPPSCTATWWSWMFELPARVDEVNTEPLVPLSPPLPVDMRMSVSTTTAGSVTTAVTLMRSRHRAR